MIILTAASANHRQPLRNLLASIRHHEPGTPVLVYDLGDLGEIEGAQTRPFDYGPHPQHVRDIRSYAWKPILIAEVLERVGVPVLWLDAGDLLVRRLDRVRAVIERHGIYTPISSGTIADWTHPTTLARLGFAHPELLALPNRNGAIVGLHPRRLDFARMWRACALQRETIAPTGSSRENHRQDQAVLTVLFYQYIAEADLVPIEKLDVTIHNDHLTVEEAARTCGISS